LVYLWKETSKYLFINLFNPISQKVIVIYYFDFTIRKFPENELTELFPDGSGDLLSENFEPAWFLLEHHHGTSFDDLRVGLSYLKRKVDSQNEGQLSFLKVSIT